MIESYASYFASYLLFNLKNKENVLSIILFGSAAKGELDKSSDVDIFIEVKKKSKTFENQLSKIINNFYNSREALIFKIKGVENKINVIAGKLKEWKDLKKSIESTGIILYGNYISSEIRGKKHVLFFWNHVGKNRGAFLNKLYGFISKGKQYKGLIENLGGKKTGKSSFIIPVEHREEFVKLMKYYDVDVKIIEIYV